MLTLGDEATTATYKYLGTPACDARHALSVSKRSKWFYLDGDDGEESASFRVHLAMREGLRFAANDREEGWLDVRAIQAYIDRYEAHRHQLADPDEPPMMRWHSDAGYAAVFEVMRKEQTVGLRLLSVDVDLGPRAALLRRCA